MQKIFYNANVLTFDENLPVAEAFLVNDGNIVLVGSNDEILTMKTDETILVDLNGKTVIPSFYDTGKSLYKMIEERLKNANLNDFLENNDEIDLNYEKFVNYEKYKNEFLEIQKDFLSNGITTVFEMNICSKEFTFWKKLSEENLLKIDVIGYIKITTDKDVMDNNCKSYRKYKNHFRLGGYYIAIDDKLINKGAWISKKYKNEKTYNGFAKAYPEQLSFLIKNALDEKKQFVVETNGDKALDLFFECFSENVKEKEENEKFRPIAKNCNFISKKQLKTMKNLGISPSFEICDVKENGKRLKQILGIFRANKVQPIKMVQDFGLKFLISSKDLKAPNIFELSNYASDRSFDGKKKLGKKFEISFDDALKSLICDSSYFAFDEQMKGSIENGKKANFVVLKYSIDEIKQNKKFDAIEKTYMGGEQVY